MATVAPSKRLLNLSADSFVTIGGNASQFVKGDGTLDINSYSLDNHLHTGVYEPVISKNGAFNKNFGSAAGTVAEGNDFRILNGQTAFNWGDHGAVGYLTSVDLPAIVDNLTSTLTDASLSANQGRVLKGFIDNINALLDSDNTALDTLQELVDYIEANRSTLESLSIGNIAGLQTELNTLQSNIDNQVHDAADITTGIISYLRLPFSSTDVSNWNTAYGWGNHASAGYASGGHNHNLNNLSDVIISTIASGEILKWNGSGWVNNTLAEAGIATSSHTHSTLTAGTGLSGSSYNGSASRTFNVSYGTSAGTAAEGNDSRINNGQTAFGWGNHASVGYLTSLPAHDHDADYVNITGDTMDGPLNINKTDTPGAVLFDIQGSAGQLFSITDSLTGDLFGVNDISGLPILNVHSDDRVEVHGELNIKTGEFSGLTTTTPIASVDVTLYDAVHYDYVIKREDAAGMRTGTIMAVWDGTNVEFADTSTVDLGGTTDSIVLSVDISNGRVRLLATITSGTWTVKSGARTL
jgi:hypothetical protein